MDRIVERWTVDELKKRFLSIGFPEYQRESTVWVQQDKQALIDSILRDFDIASLYFYTNDNKSWDCIDGRQRVNALMSFLGESDPDDDPDHRFKIRNTNEIDPNEEHPFPSLHGLTFKQIEERSEGAGADGAITGEAAAAKDKILSFKVTVVLLSEAAHDTEFNLQFTRLNLGTPINAAEKLNAMTGDMRRLCFADESVGLHPFVMNLGLPNRRFAKQLTAAQVLSQAFSKGLGRKGDFVRTRHWDLQDFFKEQFEIDPASQPIVDEVRGALDALANLDPNPSELLRSRAIAVTLVLHVWETKLYEDAAKLAAFPGFLDALLADLKSLREELNSPEAVRPELHYLLAFQRHLTQASVEARAVKERAKDFGELFDRWFEHNRIRPTEPAAE